CLACQKKRVVQCQTWIAPFRKEAGGVSKTNNRATSSRHKTTIVSFACFFPCLLFSVMFALARHVIRGEKITMLRKTMLYRISELTSGVGLIFLSVSQLQFTDGKSGQNPQIGTKRTGFPSLSHTVTWKRSRCISNLRTVRETLYQVRASARQVNIWVATVVFLGPRFSWVYFLTIQRFRKEISRVQGTWRYE
ncbi:hypothetical protein PspLS_10557, partial [Pyricularia sp. CBS 133598]